MMKNERKLNYSVVNNENEHTIVFLHGAGVSSWMWHDVAKHLSDVRAVLVDLPGHGDNADTAWISLSETAKQINHIASKQSREVHLAGLSLGAYVGFEAMRQAPTFYKSALLSGMHAPPMPNKVIMRLVTPIMSQLMTTRFFAKRHAKMLGCKTENVELFIESAIQANPKSISKATIDVINFSLPEPLVDVKTKTLFVAGAKEHTTIINSLPILAGTLRKASYQLIDNAGHAWSGEDPELFSELILKQIKYPAD